MSEVPLCPSSGEGVPPQVLHVGSYVWPTVGVYEATRHVRDIRCVRSFPRRAWILAVHEPMIQSPLPKQNLWGRRFLMSEVPL